MMYCIGAGGVGSWLVPALVRLVGSSQVTIVDGDELELKNLDRQLFTQRDLGQNKAVALAKIYECRAIPEFYSTGLINLFETDWFLVCADNHPARASALSDADARGVQVIIGANERTSAEAYYYRREWQAMPHDPRMYYPEILTNRDDDPLAASAGCTGEAAQRTPQLVSANMLAASLMMHMTMLWHLEARKLEAEIRTRFPYLMRVNMTGMELKRVCDAHQPVSATRAA